MELLDASFINCPAASAWQDAPHAPAIRESGETITYFALNDRIEKFCHYLSSLSLDKESIIAFPAERSSTSIAFLLALFRMQIKACPLHPKLPQKSLSSSLSALGKSLYLNPSEIPLSSERLERPFWELTTPSLYLFTSGSTSIQKIATFSIGKLLFSAQGFNETFLISDQCRFLFSLPLFHVSGIGIALRSLLQKALLVISQEKIEHMLSKEKITHLSLVPTQLYRLPNQEASSLQAVLLGGGPIPDHLYVKYSQALPLVPTYGMTEMGSTITINREKDSFLHLGKCLPYRSLAITNTGEILVKGQTLFDGYLKNGQITLPINEDGFFATSDLGQLINGNLVFHGRKDLIFISGGENISPEEIEGHLYEIEGVIKAAVLPIEDPEFGMRPIAFIESLLLDFSEVKRKLQETLPSYKIPIHFFSFPNTESFKPSRRALKELALEFLNK